jgi:hypothetical protein
MNYRKTLLWTYLTNTFYGLLTLVFYLAAPVMLVLVGLLGTAGLFFHFSANPAIYSIGKAEQWLKAKRRSTQIPRYPKQTCSIGQDRVTATEVNASTAVWLQRTSSHHYELANTAPQHPLWEQKHRILKHHSYPLMHGLTTGLILTKQAEKATEKDDENSDWLPPHLR